jgi:hypothetical protein
MFIGAHCFFVKLFWYNYYTPYTTQSYCINDTGQIQSNGSWGNLSFLELSYNSCLDPAAQFRFRENGAMLNLKRQGCLAAFNKNVSGYNLDMFYLYVDSVSLDTAACAQKPNESIYRAITQTPEGALSVYYKGKDKSSFQTWCATRFHGIYGYLGLTTLCNSNYYSWKIFIFGKFLLNIFCMSEDFVIWDQ